MNTFIDMTSLKGVQCISVHIELHAIFLCFDENKLGELQNDSVNYHRRAMYDLNYRLSIFHACFDYSQERILGK